jgi:hypothetical protein
MVLAMACAVVGMGCATEEDVNFGDPGRVAGGIPDRPEDIMTPCEVNGACLVSWETDIFAGVFSAPIGGDVPAGGCTEGECHADGAGGLFMPPTSAAETYFNLVDYQLVGGRPYIVPCHPELSHVVCNLKFADGVDNEFVGPDKEFTGGCGSPMPKPDEDVASDPLDQDQLDALAEWILCGAPQN